MSCPGMTGGTGPSNSRVTSHSHLLGDDILLASFQNSTTVNLQAYAGQVGPNGATDIGCAAFRSSGG